MAPGRARRLGMPDVCRRPRRSCRRPRSTGRAGKWSTAAGLGECFVHGTGHGVGLDIHEAPALGEQSEDILCSGQVVTVEPGVYLPGLGGARIEDTVVTGAGCEILTVSPKV